MLRRERRRPALGRRRRAALPVQRHQPHAHLLPGRRRAAGAERHQHRPHHGRAQREPRLHRLRPQRRRRLGPGQRPGLPGRLLPLHRRGERANEVAGGDTASILPAMRNIDAALADAGLGAVKVSTAVQSGVTQGFPPSAGSFSQGHMGPIAQYLQSTGAPLLANVYPYFSYIGNKAQIDINYALFTSPGTVVQDGGNAYQNLFDALVDTLLRARERRRGERRHRRVGERLAVGGGRRGHRSQRADLQPEPHQPCRAGHAQAPRGHRDLHIRHVQRGPEARSRDGEALRIVQPGQIAGNPITFSERTDRFHTRTRQLHTDIHTQIIHKILQI